MKQRVLLGSLILSLMALASSASAQVWTAVASSGAIDDNSAATYGTDDASLFFRAGATGTIWAIYNITNPRDTSSSPSWTTLEFTASQPGGGGGVYAMATLWRLPRFSNLPNITCSAVAPATGAPSTSTCTFPSSFFDFANNYYFVKVSLGRQTTTQNVTAWSLRIF